LSLALDEAAAAGCIGMRSPTPPEARMSLNLTALLDSRRIVILITGESKWRTYIAAVQPGAVERMPVRAVLRQHLAPVEVIWSP
jgi:6-phosphogluconolactonase